MQQHQAYPSSLRKLMGTETTSRATLGAVEETFSLSSKNQKTSELIVLGTSPRTSTNNPLKLTGRSYMDGSLETRVESTVGCL